MFLACLGASDGNEGTPALPDAGALDGAITLPSVSKEIGPEGGVVQVGDVTLTIPEGTLETAQTISIAATYEAPPQGYGASSHVYRFLPDGLVFQRPVTISFTNQREPQRVIYWTDGGGQTFKRRPTTVTGSTVTSTIQHFSRGFVGLGIGIVTKMDLLFAIDNSASMGDKQQLLAEIVPDLLNRLLQPRCLGDDGKPLGSVADLLGNCALGRPEFPAVHDLHIGVVSSSLGSPGGGACGDTNKNDRAHLLNRTTAADPETDGPPVSNASPGNFLAWLPPVNANDGKPEPVVPRETDRAQLAKDFQDLVMGATDHGCGFEAQLESAYRFLIQPDPYADVENVPDGSSVPIQPDGSAPQPAPPADEDAGSAPKLVGVDKTILQQRKDFLRPDSLVAVIMLTDENESTIDPMALGGRAYRFNKVSHLKPGTRACATNPMSAQCRSCYESGASGDPACSQALDDDADQLNVRFFHTKRRFGVDPRYPIERYVRGFTERQVPNREGEHPLENGSPSFNYVGRPNCQNPLYASALPSSDNEDLCNLPPGPRSPDLIHFALVGGVPWQLLTEAPDFANPNSKSPFKRELTENDWTKILGANPLAYDFTGIDEHMRESIEKRNLGPDMANQREWDTRHRDLQFACTFPLPKPKNCEDPKYALGSCDCFHPDDSTAPQTDAPLCDPAKPHTQIRGKAFPTVNQLAVAKALHEQAFVASICPRQITNPASDDYGYRPVVTGIVNRLKLAFE